ncbi:hypothetical protein [Sphingomonas sp. PP-CE-1G-424]|uniref:hypothetical protein n=1 Tax=Sphingomonas sp. PP-CE-1G-424 TaxID=2135658 RepID=UPI0010558C33|nr:hypothetical protein [Sphingomonas sp. PP-CE-1G-424]TCP65060.1 hypothetical protein C8J43_1142 [Sphingomonas sp. PP-CE-1G-424]
MVQSYIFDDAPAISIEDYLDWVSDNVDERDVDSIAASSCMLNRLSKNKTLLNETLLDPLKRNASGAQPENKYTDATFMLGSAKNGALLVRANLWKVPKQRAGSALYENNLYSYHLPHDHNFDFLTVGFFGPGYVTDLYTYDYEMAKSRLGVPTDFKFQERTDLPVGKVMLYEKSKDVHTQHHPVSPSISINLLAITEEQTTRQQFFFDVEQGTTSGYVAGMISSRVSMIDMIGHLGILDAVEPLEAIIQNHPCARTRASAASSIIHIAPQERERLTTRFGMDESDIVKGALGIL